MLLTTLCYTTLLCHSPSNTFYVGILFPILSTVFVGTSRSSLFVLSSSNEEPCLYFICHARFSVGHYYVGDMFLSVPEKFHSLLLALFLLLFDNFLSPISLAIWQPLYYADVRIPKLIFLFFSSFNFLFFPIFKLFVLLYILLSLSSNVLNEF